MNLFDLLVSSFSSLAGHGTVRKMEQSVNADPVPAMMSGILSPSIKQAYRSFPQAISSGRAKSGTSSTKGLSLAAQ